MKTMTRYTTAVLLGVLVAAPFAAAQEKPTPASFAKQAHSGTVETRIGTLKFEGDYVTEETAVKLREELQFQAAVQTYLWSFPIANVMSLRDGHRAVGIKNTAIPIFEDYLTPKTVVPTGNQTTIYAYNVLTLGEEPMVLVVPPDVVGFVGDAWQRPQGDLGRPGPDKGKGGKFLLVPPATRARSPARDITSNPARRRTFSGSFGRSYTMETRRLRSKA